MKIYKILVYSERNEIIFPKIELVENDYNSIQFEFQFDRDFAKKIFELKKPNEKVFVKEIIDNKITLVDYDENGNIVPLINQSGQYQYEISLYETDSKLTIHKIGSFTARDEVVNINDDVIDKDARLPILDDLINTTIEVKEEVEGVGKSVKEQGEYAKTQGDYAKEQAENVINSNDAAINIIKSFEENVDQHTTVFNENANSQTKTYNDNAKEKLEAYNSNAETKTTEFDKNASDKTTSFNTNAESKTKEYNTNADTKLQAYDDNASAKLKEYNDNATSKVEEYNSNANNKTEEFNQNAGSYETRITENEKDIVDIESYLDNLTPKNSAKGELVHVTDALGLPTFETKTSGNVKQETTTGKNIAKSVKNAPISNQYIGTLYIDLMDLKPSATYTIGFIAPANCKLYFNENLFKWKEIVGTGTFQIYTITTLETLPASQYYENTGWLVLKTNSGNTVNSVINDVILAEGVVNDLTYEPYTNGASPNPEFPQEIEVLEGYNELPKHLFDTDTKHGVTITDNEDGTYTLNGTSTAGFSFTKKITTILEPGTYTINSEDAVPSGMFFNYENDNTKIWPTIHFKTFTISEKTELTTTMIWIDKGNTFDNYVFKPQIVKGNIYKPYLPYGCVGVKTHGKNELDLSKITTTSMYGIDISYNPLTKRVRFKGTATNTYPSSNRFSMFIPKGTYTFNSVGNANAFVWVRDANGTLISTFDNKNNKTITLSRDAFIMQVGIEDLVVGNTYDLEIGYQLEKGSVATEIEPYKEQIVPLDLKGNWVGKIKDTDIEDYLVTDKKKFWLVKNVRKYLFTGNEEITLERINDYGIANFFAKMSDLTGNFVCNHFIKQDTLIAETKTEGMLYTINGPYIRIKSSIASTVDEFKQWLSENNVEVIYPLETPEIIELGELPEQIKTFEGTNNIQVLANLDTEIEVKYALDIKKYADNKLAEISAQII